MVPGKTYTPDDFLRIAWRRRWLIAIPFVLAGIGATVYAKYLPPSYQAETLIQVVPQRVPESYVRSTVTASIEERLQSIQAQISSRSRLQGVIQDLNLFVDERQQGWAMEDVVEWMRGNIGVEMLTADTFQISFVSTDPRTAMRVAERLASLFISQNLRDRELLADGTSQFLDGELDTARRLLVEQEKRLEDFRRRYAGQLPEQVDANLQSIENTRLQIQTLLEAISRDRDRKLVVERSLADATMLGALTDAEVGETAGAEGASAAEQLEAARMELRELELRLKPLHPDIVQAKRMIRSLEKNAEAEALQHPLSEGGRPLTAVELARQNRISEMRAELENLDQSIKDNEAEVVGAHQIIANYMAQVDAAPTRESDLIKLTRDYHTHNQVYTTLLLNRQEARIAANLERRQIGEQFRVLDPPRLPAQPVSVNRVRFSLLGALLGLGLGAGLSALLEVRDSSLRTDEDVVAALALPVLATIPLMVTSAERRTRRRRRLVWSLTAGTTAVVGVAVLAWKLATS